jgi:hypothetical protein
MSGVFALIMILTQFRITGFVLTFRTDVLPPWLLLAQVDAGLVDAFCVVCYTGCLQGFRASRRGRRVITFTNYRRLIISFPFYISNWPVLKIFLYNENTSLYHLSINHNKIHWFWKWRQNFSPKRQTRLVILGPTRKITLWRHLFKRIIDPQLRLIQKVAFIRFTKEISHMVSHWMDYGNAIGYIQSVRRRVFRFWYFITHRCSKLHF